jgi:choline kinase
MRYIILADGSGERWGNYTGVPKHLVEIKGEPIIARTVRLLKERGATDIIITSHDERYNFAERYEPENNTLEIDKYYSTNPLWNGDITFLYGDVYFTEDAMDKIVSHTPEDFVFFGRKGESLSGCPWGELFASKFKTDYLIDLSKACLKVRQGIIDGTVRKGRGGGWWLYRTLVNAPDWNKTTFHGHFYEIDDLTDDIDFPSDLDNLLKVIK